MPQTSLGAYEAPWKSHSTCEEGLSVGEGGVEEGRDNLKNA